MRRKTALGIVAALVAASALVLSPAPAQAISATGPTPVQDRSGTDVEMRTLLTDAVKAGVPGVVARVQDGCDIRLAAAGVADLATGAPLRPEARFRVGSITKTFVATVVLQLVGEGRLSLDEKVGARLPGLLAKGNRITVRQLLNHTSGLFDYTGDPALGDGVDRNKVFTPKELIAIAERHPSVFAPGASWAYSNTNYIVAGLLVEAVTHHRLGDELRKRVFGPLHLERTSFPVATGRIPGYHAHGYVSTDAVPTPDGRPIDVTGLNPSAAWAAGAIISNAADLSRFYRALMSGRLLTPSLLREMKTTVPMDPADPQQSRYGLGIVRFQEACGVTWGHNGAIAGYQDLALWNERTGRTIVVASTMFPAPAAADAAVSKVVDLAVCGRPAGQRPRARTSGSMMVRHD